MIEKTIIEYLESKLSVSVYAETPVYVPEKYIVIQKLGGSMTNRIFNSQIAVQSISSTSLYDAAELNNVVVSNMIDIVDETEIASCKLNSNYNFTNTATKQYRYQAVFDVYY